MYIQGESYVPILQIEAVLRLLKKLRLIFLVSFNISCFSIRKNIFLHIFYTPGLQHNLRHNFSIVPTCPRCQGAGREVYVGPEAYAGVLQQKVRKMERPGHTGETASSEEVEVEEPQRDRVWEKNKWRRIRTKDIEKK